MYRNILLPLVLCLATQAGHTAPQQFDIEPTHTYPSFEADHMGGLSVWRGKFNTTSGMVTLDPKTYQGNVDITIDTKSVDFGLDAMNEKARSSELLNTDKYPTATYKGVFSAFKKGKPTQIKGELTLNGITQPLTLNLLQAKCIDHPFFKRMACGADAYARFDRSTFGINLGKEYGFDMQVILRIQVEAIAKP